jgi:hypothetical protein
MATNKEAVQGNDSRIQRVACLSLTGSRNPLSM